ncbi:hypothetical protein J2X02_003475 [Pseudoxanthomonas japonensis]|uniref:hypothetical protein n=1 Tax=Pseudoxanthomonas japonensis TaxID=69284 RepID=UPI00285EB017|nr:hypothetical protein [Pseudoxanthomonas japonensis]MDR7070610.1 hypothetical protein [Pseudoxanthomonas japonensis]
MSNDNNSSQPQPGQWIREHGGTQLGIGKTQRSTHEYVLPDGRVAQIGVRVCEESARSISQNAHEERLAKVYPPDLTENLERAVSALEQRLNEFTGYDKEGKLIFKLQGRARDIAQGQLDSKGFALDVARRDRADAERIQAERKRAAAERDQRIEKLAQERAVQLAEEAEIERRAKVIAEQARKKVIG